MKRILEADLRPYMEAVFQAWGTPEIDAAEIVNHLIDSNLTGHDSHGILRAPWYLEKVKNGDLVADAQPQVLEETPSTAIVDGGWGFGMVACRKAIELCIDKAQSQNIACVTVRNANHIGRVGYYTDIAASLGMVGMGGANLHGSSHCVAPFGGIDRKLPTNPISFAIPTGKDPNMVVDLTTSIVAEGKLQLRRNNGALAEPGWIIDSEGHPTLEPGDFYNEPKGALLPMGGSVGHKGYALSMAMDALSGGLSGAMCSNPKGTRHGNASWFVVIKTAAFVPVQAFESNISDLIAHATSSRPAEGVDRVRYPGEPEAETREDRLANGIVLDDRTWDWFSEVAAEKGVTYTGFVDDVS